jgi:RNA polymerase-associated protein
MIEGRRESPLFIYSGVLFMSVITRRSTMALFSDGASHLSHCVRIVLAEKDITVEIIDTHPSDIPEEVSEHNPYNSLPTLVDRELALYDAWVMMEYLDERFPHPPLLPVYPVTRAQTRLLHKRMDRDWGALISAIEQGDKATASKAAKELKETLMAIAPIFNEKPYFMNDELTLVDCCLVPILWRLPALGIDLPNNKQTKPLHDYMERMFKRRAFKASLSEQEKEMRPERVEQK